MIYPTLAEVTAQGWTYLERYGSVYKTEGEELMTAPVFQNNTVEMDNIGPVELDMIDEEVATDLKVTFKL